MRVSRNQASDPIAELSVSAFAAAIYRRDCVRRQACGAADRFQDHGTPLDLAVCADIKPAGVRRQIQGSDR